MMGRWEDNQVQFLYAFDLDKIVQPTIWSVRSALFLT